MSSFISWLFRLFRSVFDFKPGSSEPSGPDSLSSPVSADDGKAVTKRVESHDGAVLDSTKNLIFQITSSFEGSRLGVINYSNLTGNFDGMGFSIGFLQWNPGQDSDRPLFADMLNNYPDVSKSVFGDKFEEIVEATSMPTPNRLQWAVGLNTPNQRDIKPPWKQIFLDLCATPEFQGVQRKFAQPKVEKAIRYCDAYGCRSVRALSLMFDIVVQNGSIGRSVNQKILSCKDKAERDRGRELTEREYLEIIATERANASNPRWVADVKSRKLCIVHGSGRVHGRHYDLDAFGLSDDDFRCKEE